jgi:S-DNA-T family DNA segregation ATPase FtsK/SpoIIIE
LTFERPGQAVRVTARTGITVYQGFESWTRRAWDASTMGVYRRQIRAAEAMGDHERLAEWVERKEQTKERRRAWLRDLPALVAGLARIAVGTVAATVLLVLLTGVFVQLSGAGEFTGFLMGIMNVMRWGVHRDRHHLDPAGPVGAVLAAARRLSGGPPPGRRPLVAGHVLGRGRGRDDR